MRAMIAEVRPSRIFLSSAACASVIIAMLRGECRGYDVPRVGLCKGENEINLYGCGSGI